MVESIKTGMRQNFKRNQTIIRVRKEARWLLSAGSLLAVFFSLTPGQCQQTEPTTASGSGAAVERQVGTVRSVQGSTVTLTTDAGADVMVSIQDSTRMVRTQPGQTSLKDATPIALSDVQEGDRILARGTAGPDGKSVVAVSVIVMKKTDVASRQQQQREDWQKRGAGGLVKSVDPTAGIIQISIAGFGGTKNLAIHVAKTTVIRRYSPDSVKFDDARPGTLDQIRPGDQLRVRGARNADGSEIDAEEIVSGSFRNIAGTVVAADTAQNTVTVMDAFTKKPVTVKITADSQLRQLPAQLAMVMAARLKGADANSPTPGGNGGPAGFAPGSGANSNMPRSSASGPGSFRGGGGNFGGGRAPDFQQMLGRLPSASIADLHKGDAVMLVATEGSDNFAPSAITLLTGVEPILTASPTNGNAATLLSPWNLGASGAAEEAAQ